MKKTMKKNVMLHIDTSSNQTVSVALEMDGKKDVVEQALDRQKAQVVLPMIATLLKTHHIEPKDLTEISVITGPGSFTGLRVGVAIANTLGTFLKIPINGKQVGEIVEPVYTESIFDR